MGNLHTEDMPNFSHATFIGHLGRDPEIREAGSSKVCKFSIAVNNPRRKDDPTLWVDVEFWGRQGEVVEQHFSKGDPILVSGTLTANEWTSKETGEVRKSIVLNGDNFAFVGGKQDDGGGRNTKPSDDDIPF